MAKAQPKRDERIRLEKHLWDGIDWVRSEHPGNISRNTWITEAVLEKLQRDVARGPLGRVADA